MKIGVGDIFAYRTHEFPIFFDTTIPNIYVPFSIYPLVEELLYTNITSKGVAENGVVTLDCEEALESMPPFAVLIDGVYIEILPEKYLLKAGNGTCYSGIIQAGGEYY